MCRRTHNIPFIKTCKDPNPIDDGNCFSTLLGMAMDSVCTSEALVECQEYCCCSRRSSADMNCRRANSVKMVRKAATHNNYHYHSQTVRLLLCSGFQRLGHAGLQSDIVWFPLFCQSRVFVCVSACALWCFVVRCLSFCCVLAGLFVYLIVVLAVYLPRNK